jgi:hypothetical protein
MSTIQPPRPRPPKPKHVPTTPRAYFLYFSRNKHFRSHHVSTALAQFSPVVATDQVTARAVTFSIIPFGGTTAGTPVIVAAQPTDTTAETTCNPGDNVSFFVDDTNSFGTSVNSNTISAVDPTPPPTAVPTTPTAIGLTFGP